MDVRISQPLGFSQSGSRPNNEDAFFPEPQQATPQQRWFLVCDGVGGAERGEVASQMAVTQFDAYFRRNPVAVATDAYIQQALTTVQDAFDAYLSANPQAEGMGTTLTLLYIHEAGATIAHLGDSRVYLVRQGEIEWRTDDHSYVNELVKAGVLKPADAQRHPQRNVITRAIQGGEKRAEAAVQIINDLRAGDYFFLCTDGVLERISDELLENTLGSLNTDDEKLRMLWGFCHGQTRDNFTGYLIPIASVAGDVAAPYQVAKPTYDRSYIDADNSVTVISAPSRPVPPLTPAPVAVPVPAPQPSPVPVQRPVSEPVVAASPRPAPAAAAEPIPTAPARSSSSRVLIGVALLFGAIALAIGGYVLWQRLQQADRREAGQPEPTPTASQTGQPVKPVLSAQQTQVITQGAQKVRPDQSSSQTTTAAPATTIAAEGATVVKAVTSAEATLAAAKAETKPDNVTPDKPTETAPIVRETNATGVFLGQKNGKYGLLRKDKKTWLIEPEFDKIGSFKVGITDAQKGTQTTYLTRDGHRYDEVGSRDNIACDRIWARKGNEYRYLNKNGEAPTRFRYDKAGEFSASCTAEVKKDGRTFLIDKNGNEVKKGAEVNAKADNAK